MGGPPVPVVRHRRHRPRSGPGDDGLCVAVPAKDIDALALGQDRVAVGTEVPGRFSELRPAVQEIAKDQDAFFGVGICDQQTGVSWCRDRLHAGREPVQEGDVAGQRSQHSFRVGTDATRLSRSAPPGPRPRSTSKVCDPARIRNDPTFCPTRQTLARLADRWTVELIESLSSGAKRFGELRAAATGISDKMLTQTLRSLERDGLVRRRVLPGAPAGAEYHLSDLGRPSSNP
jgi:DNA-binding HxlR family transcriptional regulator